MGVKIIYLRQSRIINSKRIQELVEQPGESLAVKLKTWINPNQPDGIPK